MVYTTIFMFVAVAAFVVVNEMQASEVPLQQNILAKDTGQTFVSTITLAIKGGQGFSYNFTFPKTIFGHPYTIDMRNMNGQKPAMLIEWDGDYGNFSYQYYVPAFRYSFSGDCLNGANGNILTSDQCSNMLMLANDGESITLTQLQ